MPSGGVITQTKKKLAKFELLKFRFGTTRECSDSALYFGREVGNSQNQTLDFTMRRRDETGGREKRNETCILTYDMKLVIRKRVI